MDLQNPLLAYLGVGLSEWTAGHCRFYLDVEPRHLNRQASLQGGVIATLLDAACGYAGLTPDGEEAQDHAVTVMLTISYLAKVDSGRLFATGRLTHMGRRLYFASGQVATSENKIIASAQGTFRRSQ
ncbi:PaaI family thioesterase [Bradyrhizobium erythrophlei]|uniref:PaaI family thioesterase n=1 Tax=Bradyrhizobium erythrophlei TaxID=1437360 RepID=UPI0035E5C0FA